ncbi:hypothetical protein BAG01nite_12810 [Brevibacillus agri]|uniref:Holin n=1 Tax=Brevibacillus agri TaxID=51101 RepID=A0A3M8ASC8_9BACL|nr:hypothetical protein [Brevibacillus agri]QAV13242.1 hypothetical protein BA6348_11055 [Brevibacillus agri]RNB54118.1 hypothetical protein EB820_14490 [Brevibacillus agri]GED25179.1 hypothetical protein BAG01nite_12810 [Brevibacillus agri]
MSEQYQNGKAKAVKTVANIQVVVGIIAGIVAGNITRDFSWSIAIYVWVASIFSTIILHGFAEVIELLSDIYKKINILEEIKNKINKPVA